MIIMQIAVACVAAICIVISNMVIYRQLASRRSAELQALVGNIKAENPSMDDSEIIKALQFTKDYSSGGGIKPFNSEGSSISDTSQTGSEILEKYGYDDYYYRQELSDIMRKIIIIDILILIAAIGAVSILYIMDTRGRARRIDEITEYLQALNAGNYQLDITDNSEDGMSKLRNEVYRTTVILRESSEYEIKKNLELQKSMADISHQLRTPLASMMIMLDDLQEDTEMPEETRQEFIKNITSEVEWISGLVNSMLKLARFDAGTIKMKRKRTFIPDLIQEVEDKLSVILDIRGVALKKEYLSEGEMSEDTGHGSRAPYLEIDSAWMKEALSNIIKNCAEHTPAGKNIYISYDINSVYMDIIIRDEGEGISEKDLKHIYDRFYKAENSSSESIGIGLSLAKSIVEANGGYIMTESEKGVGTSFRIRF